MKKKITILFGLILLVAFYSEIKVCAAGGGVTKVKFGTTYKSFDLDGDGKKDTFKAKVVSPSSNKGSDMETIYIYVNNKKVFQQTIEELPRWDVRLVTVHSGETLIDISSYVADHGVAHKLYQVQNGKMKMLYDFFKYYDRYTYGNSIYVEIENVKGNTLITKASAQFNSTGIMNWNMNFVLKEGKIKRTSNQFTPIFYKKNHWTAQKKINVYKTAGSSTFAYTLNQGDVVQINKIIFKDLKVFFQVKNKGGKIGYIICPKTWQNQNYFKEAECAD